MKYLEDKEYLWNPFVGDGNQPSEYVVFGSNGKLKNNGKVKTGYIYIGKYEYKKKKSSICSFVEALILNTPITEHEAKPEKNGYFSGRNGNYSKRAVIKINDKIYVSEMYEPHGSTINKNENLVLLFGHEDIHLFRYDDNNDLKCILNAETR